MPCPTLYALSQRVYERTSTTLGSEHALSVLIDHVCYCDHDYCASLEPHEPDRSAPASDQRTDLLSWASDIAHFAYAE